MNPRFTIAIPTFNRAEWLARCVRSALAQTHGSFEVLVSDNASDDATPQVLAELADPRLITIRQPRNIGPIPNWNACVEHARGEFIVMLNDDDYLAPDFLRSCEGLVTNHATPVRVLVALGDVVNPGTGWMSPARRSQKLQTGIHRGTDVLSEFLRGAISPQLCTVAMRTESLRGAGGFPEGWHHTVDLVAWVPLTLDEHVGFVNEACGTRSTHAETQTASMALELRLEEIDRLGQVLLDAAGAIDDRATAGTISRLTRRYVARNLCGHIGSERRGGASRRAVASTAWRWRHRLVDLRPGDLPVALRPIGLFLAPAWLAGVMSRARRGWTMRADARRRTVTLHP